MKLYTTNTQGDMFQIKFHSQIKEAFLIYYTLRALDIHAEYEELISVDLINETLNDELESLGYSHAFASSINLGHI